MLDIAGPSFGPSVGLIGWAETLDPIGWVWVKIELCPKLGKFNHTYHTKMIRKIRKCTLWQFNCLLWNLLSLLKHSKLSHPMGHGFPIANRNSLPQNRTFPIVWLPGRGVPHWNAPFSSLVSIAQSHGMLWPIYRWFLPIKSRDFP